MLPVKGEQAEFPEQLGLIVQGRSPGDTPVPSLSAEQDTDILLLGLLVDSFQPIRILNKFIGHFHNAQPILDIVIGVTFRKIQQARLNIPHIIYRFLNKGAFIGNPVAELEAGKAVYRIRAEGIELLAAAAQLLRCKTDDRTGIQPSAQVSTRCTVGAEPILHRPSKHFPECFLVLPVGAKPQLRGSLDC
ncbi:hypothetical protein D3C80_1442040 [compost metagenome]